MPVLLPPMNGDPILGDVINEVDSTDNLPQETSRTSSVFETEDVEQIIGGVTLALAITYLVATFALYGYYYSTTFDFSDLKIARSISDNRVGVPTSSDPTSVYSFPSILEALESSFLRWGIAGREEEGCRRKIVCEILLPTSTSMTKNRKAINTISQILSHALEADRSWKGEMTKEQQKVKEFIRAAKAGLEDESCDQYFKYCPEFTLESITESLRK